MALNWTMLDEKRNPVPLPEELTIKTVDSGAEFTLIIPDALPEGSAQAGGSGGEKKLKDSGRLWLTDQRLIFVSSTSNTTFESLSIPLLSIISSSFEQPYFGANYLSLEIRPSPEGGLTKDTKAELRFKDRGIFEFVASLEKTRERAIYAKRQQAEDEDGLPTYEPPPFATSSSSSAGPAGARSVSQPYADAPPGYDA